VYHRRRVTSSGRLATAVTSPHRRCLQLHFVCQRREGDDTLSRSLAHMRWYRVARVVCRWCARMPTAKKVGEMWVSSGWVVVPRLSALSSGRFFWRSAAVAGSRCALLTCALALRSAIPRPPPVAPSWHTSNTRTLHTLDRQHQAHTLRHTHQIDAAHRIDEYSPARAHSSTATLCLIHTS
jgi:hypothetical protein